MFFARLYAWFYIFMYRHFGLTPRGLGFLLRRISRDHILKVQGRKIYMNPKVSSSYAPYARLIVGRWNEEETHIFMHRVAAQLKDITFVDVGASIGEMVTDFASLASVKQVVAFEPDPMCARVIEVNSLLNCQENVTVFAAAVADKKGSMFLSGAGSPQVSLSSRPKADDDVEVDVLRLDDCFKNHGFGGDKKGRQLIMLIDVEGAELTVLQGAKKLLKKQQPLIIFEYNHISRRFFTLQQVQALLGPHYQIYRLNQQGVLDTDFDHTWNCVAVPDHLHFIVDRC